MRHGSVALLSALALGLVSTARAEGIAAELNGRLVSLKGRTTVPYPGAELAHAKYIALYYSAGWCGPCHVFTPALVEFYKKMKPQYPDFEVIFVSQDRSEKEMQSYMLEMSMPWPAVRYDFAKSSQALNKYCGPAIPCLVLLNDKGEVISDSFADGKYLGPGKVGNDLQSLLAAEPPAPLKDNAAQPGTSIKSPSGTNWDETFKKKAP
jgi:nucleoredoxin